MAVLLSAFLLIVFLHPVMYTYPPLSTADICLHTAGLAWLVGATHLLLYRRQQKGSGDSLSMPSFVCSAFPSFLPFPIPLFPSIILVL